MLKELARELHDGLCQDIALIAAHTRCLQSRHGEDETLDLIAEAAERALDEARWAVAALTADGPEQLLASLRAFARRASESLDCTIEVVERDGEPSGTTNLSVLREAREEVLMLARSGARVVAIEVGERGAIRVQRSDAP